jgi:hypothetical protein
MGCPHHDLTETFTNLWKYNIKLNPQKCMFGIPSGQLLGYIVLKRGIEANPEKIDAIGNFAKRSASLMCKSS